MEATAVRESHIAAAGFHGDCMCGAAVLWMSAELGRGEGGPEAAAAAAGGVALIEIMIIAVSKLRSFM